MEKTINWHACQRHHIYNIYHNIFNSNEHRRLVVQKLLNYQKISETNEQTMSLTILVGPHVSTCVNWWSWYLKAHNRPCAHVFVHGGMDLGRWVRWHIASSNHYPPHSAQPPTETSRTHRIWDSSFALPGMPNRSFPRGPRVMHTREWLALLALYFRTSFW